MSTECSTTRKPNAVIQGMARHPNIFAFILAVIVSIIANYGDSLGFLSISSFNSKPVVVPAKQPKFWFPPHQSIIVDSPRGSLLPVVSRLKKDEVVFVMFYAHWCARSIEAKAEFEKAAAILQGKVTFASVNCWWPEGECSKQYKFLMYPAFFAYHTNLEGFKFIGLAQADYMVKFVESLLHPVSLVVSATQVQELIAKHDTAVFGYFNLMSDVHTGSYRQFYYAAMRILEKDPFQPVHFAVICNSNLAQQVHLNEQGDIIMAGITKSTLRFPLKNNITSNNLIKWVLQHKGMPAVKRLSPLGVKSVQVFSEIKKGPALILFHKENVLFGAESGMRVVKDIALQYKSCHLRPEYQSLHRVWARIVEDDIKLYNRLSKMCRNIRKSQLLLRNYPCCMSAVKETIKQNTLICDVCTTFNKLSCKISSAQIGSVLSHTPLVEDCYSTVGPRLDVIDYNVCCYNSSQHHFNAAEWVQYKQDPIDKVSSGNEGGVNQNINERRLTDRFYTDHLETLPRRLCSRLAIQKPDMDESEEGEIIATELEHFKESSCKFNRTLNFYSVDSKNNWMIRQRLGLIFGAAMASSSPEIIIFDMKNEEHYVMHGNVTFSNTMSFILNFQQGNLLRHMDAHSFGTSNCAENSDSICVRELDSSNFLDEVKDESKDVVVLIYAHWCGPCQTLSHTFLSVTRYFSSSKYISFARINGARNDFPWEYTVGVFPTILFFPAHRKADSIMFPPWKDKSMTNLIRFILRHTTFDTRLLLAADVCSKSCIDKNLNDTLALAHELRVRYDRSHIKLKEVQSILSEQKSDQHSYFWYLYEFLSKHLKKINSRMGHVKKLIEYLRRNVNGVIDRKELMNLFIL